MQPISGLTFSAAQSPASISGVKEIPKVQQPEEKDQNRPTRPMMDEYVLEEKQEPTGRYWLGKDENGQPKIYFDDPERGRSAEDPDKKISDDKAESCTCSTDKVDREIEKLKKKQEELERRINSETDDTKIKELEKKLAQVESELSQKDNDTYRRQHSTFS